MLPFLSPPRESRYAHGISRLNRGDCWHRHRATSSTNPNTSGHALPAADSGHDDASVWGSIRIPCSIIPRTPQWLSMSLTIYLSVSPKKPRELMTQVAPISETPSTPPSLLDSAGFGLLSPPSGDQGLKTTWWVAKDTAPMGQTSNQYWENQPDVSPDGQQVVFGFHALAQSPKPVEGTDPGWDVAAMNTDGSGMHTLISAETSLPASALDSTCNPETR